MSGCIEKIFKNCFAPCLVSNKGRLFVIFLWILAIVAASFGIKLLESNFSFDFFVPRGSMTEQYLEVFNGQFDFGNTIKIYHESPEADWSSEEFQLKLIALDDYLERCYLCEK